MLTVYRGERFEKESILDVRVHLKPTKTLQDTHFISWHPPGVRIMGFFKGEDLRLLRTNSSQKLHLKKHYTIQTRITQQRLPTAK